jgi:hypothetical protein
MATKKKQPADTATQEKFALVNGVYLVYKDKTYRPFNADLASSLAKDVESIGIIYDGHAFRIAPEDLGSWPLVRDTRKSPEWSPNYKTECQGLHDWDFEVATACIRLEGTDIPLPEDWCIPTLAVLDLMCYMKDSINKALSFAGGKIMPDEPHWSSTESYRSSGRLVHFNNGNTYYNNKYYSYVVRPVAAWDILGKAE